MQPAQSLPADVYFFNASNDIALGVNTPSFTPSRIIKKLEDDLAVIPYVFARKDDIVIVDHLPGDEFVASVTSLGFDVPRFVARKDFFNPRFLTRQNLGTIKPWGWSPAASKQFEAVVPYMSEQFRSGVHASFNPLLRHISSRETSRWVLEKILEGGYRFVIDADMLPRKATNIDEVESLFLVWQKLVVKEPWSSSGRGVYMLTSGEIDDYSRKNILSAIRRQGFVMVEPWFKKIEDLSFLFAVSRQSVLYLGESIFLTKPGGEYVGSYINQGTTHQASSQVLGSVEANALIDDLSRRLEETGLPSCYNGWIGVDAMVVEHAGRVLLHPCLEINCRYTMGHVSFVLRERVTPATTALLKVGGIDEYGEVSRNRQGVVTRDGLIAGGVCALSPVGPDTRFVCWIEVG